MGAIEKLITFSVKTEGLCVCVVVGTIEMLTTFPVPLKVSVLCQHRVQLVLCGVAGFCQLQHIISACLLWSDRAPSVPFVCIFTFVCVCVCVCVCV